MVDIDNKAKKCSICKKEYTSLHIAIPTGGELYVCEVCLKTSETNFIFLCMSCGRVYLRPKEEMIRRCKDVSVKRAYEECKDMQMIQGIDMCISCDPKGILNQMDPKDMGMEC